MKRSVTYHFSIDMNTTLEERGSIKCIKSRSIIDIKNAHFFDFLTTQKIYIWILLSTQDDLMLLKSDSLRNVPINLSNIVSHWGIIFIEDDIIRCDISWELFDEWSECLDEPRIGSCSEEEEMCFEGFRDSVDDGSTVEVAGDIFDS